MANPPNLYPALTFPEYVFAEYPKWVTGPDGVNVIVEDTFQEARALAGGDLTEPTTEAEANMRRDRDALIAKATQKGIAVDKRWGVDKLKAALEAA